MTLAVAAGPRNKHLPVFSESPDWHALRCAPARLDCHHRGPAAPPLRTHAQREGHVSLGSLALRHEGRAGRGQGQGSARRVRRMGAGRVWRRSEQRRQLRSLASSAAGSGAADGRRVVHLAPALAEGLPPAGRWLRRLLYPPIAAITEAAGSGGGGERGGCTSLHRPASPCTAITHRAMRLFFCARSSRHPSHPNHRKSPPRTCKSSCVQSHKAKGAASVLERATRCPKLARSSEPRP